MVGTPKRKSLVRIIPPSGSLLSQMSGAREKIPWDEIEKIADGIN